MSLSQLQLDRFSADGYLVVPDLVPASTLEGLRARIDQIEADASGAQAHAHQFETAVATRALRKLDEPARRDPIFRAAIATPALLAIAYELTGGGDAGLACYSDQVFMKPARCGSEKPLHQDNSYFRVTPNSTGITCWLAIDDATTANGCLHYVPGSHRLGLLNHRSINHIHLTPDVDAPLGAEVAVPVRAGTCIFHHLLTLHGSKANLSEHPRRAYAIHYANRCATASNRAWADMIELVEPGLRSPARSAIS
ncbi:MAG: phytanoyl-CoA dioxygenase family protein [Planctomycetes bacterium]|nr:phytanoyl-CoA dioxygenase family protein [Planctomycetota bacterium]